MKTVAVPPQAAEIYALLDQAREDELLVRTADGSEFLLSAVDDFDQELTPALLDQLRFRRPGGHLHAHFRIDLDAEQAVPVQNLLQLFRRAFGVGVLHGGIHRLFLTGAEG